MKLKTIYLFFLAVFLPPLTCSAQTPTLVPTAPLLTRTVKMQIDWIAKMRAGIDEAIQAKKLKERDQTSSEGGGEAGSDAHLYTDNKGVVRAYEWEAGDGDMDFGYHFYYDEAGRLRLVLAHFGHYAIGAKDETVYLNAQRDVLRVYVEEQPGEEDNDKGTPLPRKPAVRKELAAPEDLPYTGGPVQFVWDPQKDFEDFNKSAGD